MEIGEYFIIQLLVWSTNFFPKTKMSDVFRTKLIWAGAGSGLGLVCQVVFWVFFEMSLLITLEPHVGHTKFPDFHSFILDNNPFVR